MEGKKDAVHMIEAGQIICVCYGGRKEGKKEKHRLQNWHGTNYLYVLWLDGRKEGKTDGVPIIREGQIIQACCGWMEERKERRRPHENASGSH